MWDRRWAMLAMVALVSCSRSESPDGAMAMKSITTADSEVAPAEAPAPADIKTSLPQIAYRYTYGYRVGSSAIDTIQAQHIALCDKLAHARCRIGSMRRSSVDGEFAQASLSLLVDAGLARAFGGELDKAAAASGGESSDRGIEAEDLTKQMIDTQARVDAKQALADRLMTLIRTGGGKVGELVEAERAFADAQEQLDSARSNMADMKGRVALSRVDISYTSRSASGGFLRPVRDAIGSAGQTFGTTLAALVTFVIAVTPWILLLAALLWIKRRMGWSTGIRWPWRRKAID